MGCSTLDLRQARDMFVFVARGMVDFKDALTQADKAIGDGDHGIGMARGFEAVEIALTGREFASIGELFNTIGAALLMNIGGAAGAVFGTLFRGGSRQLGEQGNLSTAALATLLQDGLEAVMARGGARPGDKTMIDALYPAAQKAGELLDESLDRSLGEIAAAAHQGMEETREMVAAHGKAKTLGTRALGFADPGAISLSQIFTLMNDFVMKACAGG